MATAHGFHKGFRVLYGFRVLQGFYKGSIMGILRKTPSTRIQNVSLTALGFGVWGVYLKGQGSCKDPKL